MLVDVEIHGSIEMPLKKWYFVVTILKQNALAYQGIK